MKIARRMVVGCDILVAIGAAAMGWQMSRAMGVVYAGNTVGAVLLVELSPIAVLAQAVAATMIVVYHAQRADLCCLMAFAGVWFFAALLRPYWNGLAQWRLRQVLRLREYLFHVPVELQSPVTLPRSAKH